MISDKLKRLRKLNCHRFAHQRVVLFASTMVSMATMFATAKAEAAINVSLSVSSSSTKAAMPDGGVDLTTSSNRQWP